MKHLIATLSLATAMIACGDNQSTKSALRDASPDPIAGGGSVQPGVFKLYEQPDADPNPECDVHVKLQLINGFVAPVATLRTTVLGQCEIRVDPEPKVFNLQETAYHCGSKRYVGGSFAAGDPATMTGIEVIDNRGRSCRDRVPSAVVVNETFGDGTVVTLYSASFAAVAPVATAERGVLTRVMAVGGETTGTALTREDGTVVELDLETHGFQARFVEGRRVEVAGTLRTVQGVEIPERSVLVVETMTVL